MFNNNEKNIANAFLKLLLKIEIVELYCELKKLICLSFAYNKMYFEDKCVFNLR